MGKGRTLHAIAEKIMGMPAATAAASAREPAAGDRRHEHGQRLRRVNVPAFNGVISKRRYDVYRNKWIAQTSVAPTFLDNLFFAIKRQLFARMRASPSQVPEPEMFCRLFQRHLGAQWACRLVNCYRTGASPSVLNPSVYNAHQVLFVWRDGCDELWAVDLLSRRIRSIDIAPDYDDWEIEPVDFWLLVRGSRDKRWWFYPNS